MKKQKKNLISKETEKEKTLHSTIHKSFVKKFNTLQ